MFLKVFVVLSFFIYTPLFSAVKGPYLLYTGTPGSMTVLWQAEKSKVDTLKWGESSSDLSNAVAVDEYGYNHQHKYEITSLDIGKKYYYAVGGYGSGFFTTAPADTATEVSMLAYGDTRSYPDDHNAVCKRAITECNQDSSLNSIVLFSGDFVQDGMSEGDWISEFFPRNEPDILEFQSRIPYACCIGNHEDPGTLVHKYFPFPYKANSYGSFDYGPVHIAIVDQYVSYSPGSTQYSWLEADLSSSKKYWKVLLFHEPGYAAGGHSNNTSVQDYIQPLCEKYGVSFVINGHNHYYSRAEVNGVNHIVTGGGGAPLYSPKSNYPNIVKVDKSHHFLKLNFNRELATITAERDDGSIIEEFTVIDTTYPVSVISLSPLVTTKTVAAKSRNGITKFKVNNLKSSTVALELYSLNGVKIFYRKYKLNSNGEFTLKADKISFGSYIFRLIQEDGSVIYRGKLLLK